MIDLIAIEEVCGIAIGGFKKIFLILPEDVATETPARCLAMTDMPNLIDGKAMYPIAFDRQTGRYVEKKDISNRAGDFYDGVLDFTVKKSRIELDMLSMLLINRRVHALLIYRTGTIKYVKNLRCADESDSGNKQNRNEHRFRLTTKSTRKAGTVAGVLPAEITGIIPGAGGCLMTGISPNGHRWCITISNEGDLICTEI